MKKKVLLLTYVFAWFLVGMANGQNAKMDKAEADELLYNELKTALPPSSFKEEIVGTEDIIEKTHERNVFKVVGKSYQIESLRSDFYVTQKGGKYVALYDASHPLESFVNLLLNKVKDNRHPILITHHQYGNVIKKLKMPMANLYNLLGRTMDIYCFVTSIDKNTVSGVLVFHNAKDDIIHLLEVSAETMSVTKADAIIIADLYSNIPQDNIRSLFKERKKR
ncbi:MAG: hypothetical protein IKX24_08620 [Prevotella sp.]|nr:hypothetical protein [Prevotella sp.]MBR5062185.1 hypothetical protein [Prevotella sp.]